ncbi:MAG TPA: cellulase family glycosylhydrolase [Bacteroidales bacterium]|nr:cellulase family glycosylhydrolase [Bacteroidales bacterium]
MKKLILILLCSFVFETLTAQAPFSRGVNLTNWFQASSPGKIQFRKFTKKDFNNIKSLGCDVIRLPINLHAMTNGAPNYTIDPLFLTFLDSAVNWAEDLHLYLLIDNHTFDPATSTDPQIGQVLVKVWPQLAQRYKDRSDYILYEVLNEPHGIADQLWGEIQQQAIDAIRAVDTKHTIIVGPANWNSYHNLSQMPVYTDNNLLYTFHFYDPFVFTHQGAGWNTPPMTTLSGVPFPYDAATMPPCPPDLAGTWVEQAMNSYPEQGNVAYVHSLLDIAINFRNSRNVNIFCGEFGVYIPNSDTADRVYWYQEVKDYLEAGNIPWTTWDYKGTFGLFEKGSHEVFESDLNVPLLNALDFNVPEQHSYMVLPDTTGFIIYDDYIEQGIEEATYSTTTLDYYSTLFPNNNYYCIYWTGGQQYTTVALDFVPDRDFSQLVDSAFALDMIIRGNVAGIKFDARFMDTKTDDPNDHPWRMRTTFQDNSPPWDKRWHHVHVPLKDFTEQGAWDNGSWYNPEGKFDWKAIDRFEIVAEYASMTEKELWFDNIIVTNLDTATIIETGTLGIQQPSEAQGWNILSVSPNPVSNETLIRYSLTKSCSLRLSIFDLHGRLVKNLADQYQTEGNYSLPWKGEDVSGHKVPAGMYLCLMETPLSNKYVKIIMP